MNEYKTKNPGMPGFFVLEATAYCISSSAAKP